MVYGVAKKDDSNDGEDVGNLKVRVPSTSKLRDSILGTRNLMTVAAIAVVGCVLLIPLTYVSVAVAVSPGGIMIVCACMGLWLFPYLLPAAVTHKPGAALISSLVIGIIMSFTTPQGFASIMGSAIAGLLVEVPLAITLYRQWNWIGYGLVAIAFGAFNGLMYASFIQVPATFWMISGFAGAAIVSCLVGVALTLVAVRLLRSAGIGIVATCDSEIKVNR